VGTFDASVSAHRALPRDERDLLLAHLQTADRALATSPWRLARTPALSALQVWTEELGLFGREVLFRGADAAVVVLEEVWRRGARARPDDEVLAAIASGEMLDPSERIAAARHWLAYPSEQAALDADRTLGDDSPQLELWEPEFDYLHDRPFVWMLIAAADLVALTNHPHPEPFAGRIAVCAAAAAGLDPGLDGSALVRARVREAIETWLGAASG
jgi:hypothetical protein